MEYLISYFAVGLLLAGASLIHGTFSRTNSFVPFSITFLLWPVLVLFAPESFLSSGHIRNDNALIEHDVLKDRLVSVAQASSAVLTNEEARRLTKVAKYGGEQITDFGNRSDLFDILTKFWELNVPPEIYHSFIRANLSLGEDYDQESQPLFSRAPPDWYIGFSHEFVKSIAKVDRKKQGRILEALRKIAAAPTEVAGDTIKPLTGDLSGLWRYRIGDDRIVYFPDIQSKKVVLIAFGPRGDAYHDSVDVSAIASNINHSN
jgi:mRNA-degrading endonuclease RelE of RelBE toxin-antitoxin system